MKYLLWDFNGTIIDDLDVCIESENVIIKRFLDRPPLTKEEYLHIFTFPVKDYYERVGFDWSKFSYEEVGDCWVKEYQARENTIKLHDGVKESLIEAKQKGIKNIIFSASKHKNLVEQTKMYGIYEYFDEIYGANDVYAYGKSDKASIVIKDKDPKECLFLGDTLHDLESANAMGVECILIAKGHQAKDILLEKTNNVVDDIREVKL